MSTQDRSRSGPIGLISFAKSYFDGGRLKFLAVLVLETITTSLTGIGLLLILPLLGLLGIGAGGADNPIWRQLSDVLERLGWSLTLQSGLVVFTSAIALRALLNWRRETWQVEVEQQFQTSLRNRLYETLSRTELYCLQRLRTSEFVQSTQGEIRRVQEAANALFQLFSLLLHLGVYFLVAMILSPQMTLFAFVCGAIAVVIMLPLIRRTHVLSRQQIRIRSSMINNLFEHIQGLRTARSLGLTGRFVADYRDRSGQAAHVAVRLTRLSAMSTLAFEIVAAVLVAAIVYVGLGTLSLEPARFIVLLLVFIRLFPIIGQFQNQLQRFASLVPSFRHYQDLLAELQAHEERAAAEAAHDDLEMNRCLELRHITFRYHKSDEPVLREVSIQIRKGEMTAIGGHSGAGKTTLVDIATGLLPPGSGGLYLDGVQLDDRDRIAWRRQTALVPQESFLFNESIRENLSSAAPHATDGEIWEVLDATNCRAFIEARPMGLDSVVGERGALLSGGERQRLCIARALLRRPQLLVLDEPTNNLDSHSVDALRDVLDRLKQHATLLVVTHDPRILGQADRVYWLEAGTLATKPAHRGRRLSRILP